MDVDGKVSTPAISRISTAHEPSIVDTSQAGGASSSNSDSNSDRVGARVGVRVGASGGSETMSSRQQAAATKIQALGRGFNLRNDWAKEDAAILIQSVYRGYR